MQSSKPIDRKDGFGGGADAVIKSLENRSKNAWEGAATGPCPRAHLLKPIFLTSRSFSFCCTRRCTLLWREQGSVHPPGLCMLLYIRIVCSVYFVSYAAYIFVSHAADGVARHPGAHWRRTNDSLIAFDQETSRPSPTESPSLQKRENLY